MLICSGECDQIKDNEIKNNEVKDVEMKDEVNQILIN